nr:MAG TPA: hypothetical protein [Caudoviricetes sp.]
MRNSDFRTESSQKALAKYPTIARHHKGNGCGYSCS